MADGSCEDVLAHGEIRRHKSGVTKHMVCAQFEIDFISRRVQLLSTTASSLSHNLVEVTVTMPVAEPSIEWFGRRSTLHPQLSRHPKGIRFVHDVAMAEEQATSSPWAPASRWWQDDAPDQHLSRRCVTGELVLTSQVFPS